MLVLLTQRQRPDWSFPVFVRVRTERLSVVAPNVRALQARRQHGRWFPCLWFEAVKRRHRDRLVAIEAVGPGLDLWLRFWLRFWLWLWLFLSVRLLPLPCGLAGEFLLPLLRMR